MRFTFSVAWRHPVIPAYPATLRATKTVDAYYYSAVARMLNARHCHHGAGGYPTIVGLGKAAPGGRRPNGCPQATSKLGGAEG
jgi:hypothetical protein